TCSVAGLSFLRLLPTSNGLDDIGLGHGGFAKLLHRLDEGLADVHAGKLRIAPIAEQLDGHVEYGSVVAADDRGLFREVIGGPLSKGCYATGLRPVRPTHVWGAPLGLGDNGSGATEGDRKGELCHLELLFEEFHGVLVRATETVDGLTLVAHRDH